MPPLKDMAKGFLLAPLVPAALVSGIAGYVDAGDVAGATPLDTLLHTAFVFVFLSIGCWFVSAVLALPLYLLCWRFLRVDLIVCVLGGVLIGGMPTLVPFLLQYYGRMPNFDSESLGGVMLVDNGHFTAAGIANYLQGVAESASFGAAVGFFFWWSAIKGNPAAQRRGSRGVGS